MKKEQIKKNYLKKIKLIEKYNRLYYDKNTSLVNDQEFDVLKKETIEFEEKYDFLKDKKSPSVTVGFQPSKNFKKVRHRVSMLSLSNAFNKEDLINFEKKYLIF